MSKRFAGRAVVPGPVHLRYQDDDGLLPYLGLDKKKAVGRTLTALCVAQKWRCKYCGCDLNSGNATIDHVMPKSRGGSRSKSDFTNLVAACRTCNQDKGDKLLSEWTPPLKAIVHRVKRKESIDMTVEAQRTGC